MAVWRDGVESHPAFQALSDAQATLDAIVPRAGDQLDQIARARAATSAIRAALGSADQQLLSDRSLDEFAGNANQVRDSASAYSVSGDVAHLAGLQDNIDVILASIGLGAFYAPGVVDAMRDSLNRYRRAGRDLVAKLENDVSDVDTEVETSRANLDKLQVDIDAAAAKVGDDVSAAMAPTVAKATDLSNLIAAETTKVTTLIENQTKAFEVEVADRGRDWLDSMALREKAANEAQAAVNASAKDQRAEIKATAESLVDSLREHETDAKATVTAIGALGIAGGFGEYAKQERDRADLWSKVTIVALIVASLPGAWYYISVTLGWQAPLDLERFIERIITGGPLYVIAGYAAIQGARSRENERHARAKDLELAAIGPYLARLEPDHRDAMTMVLAPRYFGERTPGAMGNEGIAAGEIIKAIEDVGKTS